MNKLKAFREKYGLEQKQVAEKLKYSVSQIQRLENSEKSYGSKINRRILSQLENWAAEAKLKNKSLTSKSG